MLSDVLQRPRSAGPYQKAATAPETSPLEAPDLRRNARATDFTGSAEETRFRPELDQPPDLEEFFDCVIEEVTDNTLRLHTRALSGEEAVAWLPMEKVPPSERRHVMLGAPLRVSIYKRNNNGTAQRFEEIRVLRPDQWQVPVSRQGLDDVASMLLERMRGVLTQR